MKLLEPSQLRPINVADFRKSLKGVKPSVSSSDLQQYVDWDKLYGSN